MKDGPRGRLGNMAPWACTITIGALILAGSRAGTAATFKYDFAEQSIGLGVGIPLQVTAADFDHDPAGNDEILRYDRTHAVLSKFDSGFGGWWDVAQVNFSEPGFLQPVFDVTGDGHPDLLVVSVLPDSTRWLTCYDLNSVPASAGHIRYRIGPFLADCPPGAEGLTGRVYVRACHDADKDGRPELYILEYPYKPGGLPRRLWACDGPTGEVLWRFAVAPMIGSVDLSASTSTLILETGHATGNGFVVDGTTDAHCYVYCVSPQGQLRWRTSVDGGAATRVSLGDFDRNGTQDIFVGVAPGGSAADADPAHYLRLDPESGTAAEVPLGIPPPILQQTADLDGDGGEDLLILGVDQRLYCLSDGLVRRWRSKVGDILTIVGIGDLDGAPGAEIACLCGPRLVVLDRRGKLLASREFEEGAGPLQVRLVRVAGGNRLVLKTADYLWLMTLQRPALSPLWYQSAPFVVAGGLVILGARWRQRRRDTAPLARNSVQADLLEAMTAFGHSGSSRRTYDRLRFHLHNWERTIDKPDWGSAALGEKVRAFGTSVLPDLIGLAALARKAKAGHDCWVRLAPQAQLAFEELSALVRETAQAGTQSVSRERIAQVCAPLAEVDDCLRQLEEHLRRVFDAHLVVAAEAALARWRPELAQAGIESFLTVECDPEQHVFISGGILEKTLDGLIDNAIRAAHTDLDRRIWIALTTEGGHCRVDFGDNGCGLGLPPGQWDRIFDRHYSTKPATAGSRSGGFGLYYARKSLEPFAGRISVLESSPGKGTNFRILLQKN